MGGTMKNRSLGIFIATTALTATLGTAGLAGAWEVRRNGSACNAGSSSSITGISGNNTSSSNSVVYGCPIQDENDLPHQNIVTLNVHVTLPGGTSIPGNRCVAFFNATGGACGNASIPAGPGTVTVQPPNTPPSFAANWNNAFHFAYIVQVVPPNSQLKGYYVAN
jgi:hypothetical protein